MEYSYGVIGTKRRNNIIIVFGEMAINENNIVSVEEEAEEFPQEIITAI